mgnify:CR=1 FL=1|tara:strand:+ start:698 stop:1759 length:1062 start_codon:yes stop_codon:yes gene_type:complete
MTIYDIKARVFNDLDAPMSFLTTKGFDPPVGAPVSVQQFGAFHFFGAQGKWLVQTPPATVIKADVNAFKNGEHSITLKIEDDAWIEATKKYLVEALKLAHPHMEQSEIPVEQIVQRCYIPDLEKLEIRSKYKAKRTKVLQYVNMYNGDNEITGKCNMGPGSVVTCSILFTLSETIHEEGHIDTGFRCGFGAGIRVHTLDGLPDAIKRPWDWSTVNFDSLSVPMYNSVRVKTPAMQVSSVGVNSVQVEIKSDFKDAMNQFHAAAGADAWDEKILTSAKRPIATGDVAVATVVPKRNNRRIEWTAESLYTSRKKRQKTSASEGGPVAAVAHPQATPEEKRDGDSKDNSSDNQTTY